MHYPLERAKEKIASSLGLAEADFSYPPDSRLGQLSLAAFASAKANGQNPAELSQAWAEKLNNDPSLQGLLKQAQAAGPYLNISFDPAWLASATFKLINCHRRRYGTSQEGCGHRVLVEYSNANTHKEYHVGHLRNLSYGDAVSRLLKASGHEVIPVSYINDFGIHTAKTLWYWQKEGDKSSSQESAGYQLGQCYAAASRLLEEKPEYKAEVGSIMAEIESRRGANYRLWQKTRRWSLDYFSSIYSEFGVRFRHTFYENNLLQAGLDIARRLEDQGRLRRSDGALIADLEAEGLGVLPIIRSDGTALYPVADLALAEAKFRRYRPDQSIVVVDVRQSLYFKQLFRLLGLSGFKQEMTHLAYDFVTLPEGMMSSRSGRIITYEDLKQRLMERLAAETRSRHENWTEGRVSQVAFELAISAIKFEMLKVSADKTITFNINEALKFDGFTACYLQYSYARLKSVMRKAGLDLSLKRPDFKRLAERREQELLFKLARYPEIVRLAGRRYNPSELAKYLFELCQLVNDYYQEINILKSEPALRRARLVLVKSVAACLKNGFRLLGLRPLEEI